MTANLLLLALLVDLSFATPPTVPPFLPEVRSLILSDRYQSSDAADETNRKIGAHLARDCGGKNYGSTDLDLTAKSMLAAFPAPAIHHYLDKNTLGTCPLGIGILLSLATDSALKKRVSRLYAERYPDSPTSDGWTWQMRNWEATGELAKSLSPQCDAVDRAAIGKLICGYHKNQPYVGSELDNVQGLFEIKKQCPTFDFAKLPCSASDKGKRRE